MRAKSFNSSNQSPLDKFIRSLRQGRITQYIKPGSIVVDLGCGFDGTFLESITQKINAGAGFDLEVKKSGLPKNISLKTANLNQTVKQASSSADVVTSLAVLEHLDKPESLLKESYRILKPGGVLLLTSPSQISKPLLEFLAFKLHIISEQEIRDHKLYFSPTLLREYLVKAGFKPKNIVIENFQFGLNIFSKAIK
jgi:2-polyprenyl-3-methyl-5-hydroxy-6-metoxy-1,4-benzoquinol methylase